MVIAQHPGVVRPRQALDAVRAAHVGLDVILVALDRQLEALRPGRREHQLAEHAAAAGRLRIGLRARIAFATGLAPVFGLLALAMAHRDQARPSLATEGGGCTGEQALVRAVEADPGAEVRGIPGTPIVRRVLGHERDHPAERVGAVQRARRTTHHLDALERVQIDEVAVGTGEAADRERVRHRDAVGLDAHTVATEATDADVVEAETTEAAADGDAGLVTEQIGDVPHQQRVHARTVDDVDGGGHIADRPLCAGGGDDDLVELAHLALGRGENGGGRQAQGQGYGQQAGTHGTLAKWTSASWRARSNGAGGQPLGRGR